jgi:hypothetical protein
MKGILSLKKMRELYNAVSNQPPRPTTMWVSAYIRDGVDKSKHKGKGRPKKTDYKYIKNPLIDILNNK